MRVIQKPFLPLYRLAHWPPPTDYQHAQRQWMLQRVLQKIPSHNIRTILEVGCGDGWVTQQLVHRFKCNVLGFDYNPNRIKTSNHKQILLVAGDASKPPIANQSVDLIVSLAVLEHLPDRHNVVQQLTKILKPGGKMIHIVPTSTMKILQWAGHVPAAARKQLRGATRFLAGQRHKKKRTKYHDDRETNNPHRRQRRRWHHKWIPRVHGDYDSNLQELLENSNHHWISIFNHAGLRVIHTVPLGAFSPYFFGLSAPAKWAAHLGIASVMGYILEANNQSPINHKTHE